MTDPLRAALEWALEWVPKFTDDDHGIDPDKYRNARALLEEPRTSKAATTTSDPEGTTGTTIIDRLRALGVVSDGTYGAFLDPDKVLALAAEARPGLDVEALARAIHAWGYEPTIVVRDDVKEPTDAQQRMARKLANAYLARLTEKRP